MPAGAPSTIGFYTVEREIGRGGMGVVYLGRDTRLDRAVAIKALPELIAGDPERVARFEREAKVVASLSHPNVAGVYGFEEFAGSKYLVMEYVPGDSLAERLSEGPLAVDEALRACEQIAAGVEAAHEAGVIHRDLKPGNVKITPDGKVKVLDFGLAREVSTKTRAPSPDAATIPFEAVTRAGLVLGTPGYMSPEQARGKPVDRRTDIFAFGCLLYACLTGRTAFPGETTTDVLAAIFERDPDWSALPPKTPSRIRDLLQKCLEKDAKRRLRDIGDARLEIERALSGREWSTTSMAALESGAFRTTTRRLSWGWIAAALFVGAGLGALSIANLHSGPGASSANLQYVALPVPQGFRVQGAELSPNGRALAMRLIAIRASGANERTKLYVRRLDEPTAAPVPNSEGIERFEFSPDSRWLAFVAPVGQDSSRLRLWKVPVDGSAPAVALAELPPETGIDGVLWRQDGDFTVMTSGPQRLLRYPGAGGSMRSEVAVTLREGQVSCNSLVRSPAGGLAFTNEQAYAERGFQVSVGVIDLETGVVRTVIQDGGSAAWSPTGHIVFARGEAILAAPADPNSLEVTGGPIAIDVGARTQDPADPAAFALSVTGTLAHLPGGLIGARRSIALMDREGRTTPWSDDRIPIVGHSGALSVSPDARWAAVVVSNPVSLYEVWMSEIERPALRRTLADPAADCTVPVISRGGTMVAFVREGKDKDRRGMYVQRMDTGEQSLVARDIAPESSEFARPLAFSADGAHLIVAHYKRETTQLEWVPVVFDGTLPAAKEMLSTPSGELFASLSPDGRFLAVRTSIGGRSEGMVRVLNADGTLGAGARAPLTRLDEIGWTRRGEQGAQELLMRVQDRQMVSAVTFGESLMIAPPVAIEGLSKSMPDSLMSEGLPDGRFLVVRRGEDEAEPDYIVLVLNWVERLKRRMAESGAKP